MEGAAACAVATVLRGCPSGPLNNDHRAYCRPAAPYRCKKKLARPAVFELRESGVSLPRRACPEVRLPVGPSTHSRFVTTSNARVPVFCGLRHRYRPSRLPVGPS
eukprot:9492723-Pyramimonas_sp.AAC.2